MARSLRIEYPGAFYHLSARGFRGGKIFVNDDDRHHFLKIMSEACGMTGWRVHAWVLLSDHYHFFLETPEANLVTGMKWVQNAYTRHFNIRNRSLGKVFGDRYKSVFVEGEDSWFYTTLLDFIHLNPVRAGLVKPSKGQNLLDYPWSSVASGYALPPNARAPWLAAADGLAALDYKDTTAGRRQFVEDLDERAQVEKREDCGVVDGPADGRLSNLRHGWYWGSPAFKQKLLGILSGTVSVKRSRGSRSTPGDRKHDEKEAERIVTEGLARCGLKERELASLYGSDPRKLKIAVEVRSKTPVSLGWIAERLKMKSAANVSQYLRRFRA
jgi:REP element-mobilizing transposase RayT